jgi:transcriptional regulator with XRE-family HTH domain
MLWEVGILSFSECIKLIRKNRLLSQEAFAKELGVSFTTVNRWEKGKAKPTFKTLKRIDEYCKSNGLDIDISKLAMED